MKVKFPSKTFLKMSLFNTHKHYFFFMNEAFENPKNAPNLDKLIQYLTDLVRSGKVKKKDPEIQQFKQLIYFTISNFYESIHSKSKNIDQYITYIKYICKFFEEEKAHSIPKYLQKYYFNISKFLLINFCLTLIYTDAFTFLTDLIRSDYLSFTKEGEYDHSTIFYHSFVALLINLVTLRCPDAFLGKDAGNINNIYNYCIHLKEVPEFKFVFLKKDIGKLIQNLSTLNDQIYVDKAAYSTLSSIFGKECFKISEKQICASSFNKSTDLSLLRKTVKDLSNCSQDTPFNLFFIHSQKEREITLYPANPPFAFERELDNKMGVLIETFCHKNHQIFVPCNSTLSKPIVKMPKKCPFCKYHNEKDTAHDINKELVYDPLNQTFRSYNYEMLYPDDFNPYESDYLQNIGPLGPIEAHILRTIYFTIDMIRAYNDVNLKNLYSKQIYYCLSCISLMLFPNIQIQHSIDSSLQFVIGVIEKMVNIISATKLPSIQNDQTIANSANFSLNSGYVPSYIIFSESAGYHSVSAFRDLFAELIDTVFISMHVDKGILNDKQEKIIQFTSTKILLRKFLLSRDLRKQNPLCYNFVRLSNSLNSYDKVIPLIKDIQ